MGTVSVLLAAVFLVAGAGHFLLPRYVVALVPSWVPRARVVVVITGCLDLAVGAALLVAEVRTAAAWVAAALLAAYVLSHADAVRRLDPDGPVLTRPVVVSARVVVNLGYLGAALAVALGA